MSVHRVVALLTLQYLTILIQALLERELELPMTREGVVSLPLYYGERQRQRRAPTSRRVIDLFENVQLHGLAPLGSTAPLRFATALSELLSEVLRLLRVPATDYGA